MALNGPILDDRSYQQLRDELVKRIPVYAPEWTNHNESDPGIALLELFAYLGEALLFRFNQIPDTTRIEFLRMLGVQPRTARSATVLLAADTDVAAGVQVLKATEAKAGALSFETQDEVYAWPLDSVAVGKAPITQAATAAERERRADALARARIPFAEAAGATFYETVAVPADPLAPDAVSLEVSSTVDGSLWIALLGRKTTDLQQLAGHTLFVGVAFDQAITSFTLSPLQPKDFQLGERNTAPPPMIWQLWNPPTPQGKASFTNLRVLGDTTAGLVEDGVVKLELPKPMPVLTPGSQGKGDADSPPPLNDEKQAALVVAWLRVSRPATAADGIGRVRWVGLNAVSAVQARTATPELLGTGTGDPGQQYRLTQRPVLADTVQLQVEEADGWHDWTEVEDFIASTPDDRPFTVDLTAGTVTFNGPRLPQQGQRIRVLSYRYGGGVAGNVPAKSITAVGGVKASNPLPAMGGADAATLTEAMDSVPGQVHRRDRAVVAEDFRELAGEVTGVARAEALPLLHPDNPQVPAAGVVSMVIFPTEDLRAPDAPLPDKGLLSRVAAYLDARRLLTTELYVIPPTYVKIAVSIGVHVHDGFQVDAVRRWAELIVRQFLAPVPPYGPDGNGWPLGRTIRAAELQAVAVQVDGVDYLENLILATQQDNGDFVVPPSGTVALQPWEVPQIVDITVVEGQPLDPGQAYTPPPPTSVVVPVPPEVC
ncbi:putative baseplate assembly protein [Kutzneria sp. CA-103260]|uniref:putative baseplate assembly protein n=1 Tax=Kutzneria sp. CA-103260 TaxID=2802641 RepID=UPI001BA5C3D7|nr:putative baseplate assembly protein [Kutzneria sp. CA-103260]QUQ63886.1 putative baseplate assembly protein [Kutzneria sp. CA-103260]